MNATVTLHHICPRRLNTPTDGQTDSHTQRGGKNVKKKNGGGGVERLARKTPEQVHADGKVRSYVHACNRRLVCVWSLSGTKFMLNLKVACFFDKCHELNERRPAAPTCVSITLCLYLIIDF